MNSVGAATTTGGRLDMDPSSQHAAPSSRGGQDAAIINAGSSSSSTIRDTSSVASKAAAAMTPTTSSSAAAASNSAQSSTTTMTPALSTDRLLLPPPSASPKTSAASPLTKTEEQSPLLLSTPPPPPNDRTVPDLFPDQEIATSTIKTPHQQQAAAASSEDNTVENNSLSSFQGSCGFQSSTLEEDVVTTTAVAAGSTAVSTEFDQLSFSRNPSPPSSWPSQSQQTQQQQQQQTAGPAWALPYAHPSSSCSSPQVLATGDNNLLMDGLVPPAAAQSGSTSPSVMSSSNMESSNSSSSTRRRQSNTSRRRGAGGNNQASTPSPSSPRNPIGSLRRSKNSNHRNSNHHDTTDHSNSSTRSSGGGSSSNNTPTNSLRASLDAGMAAVRRWVRSNSFSSASASSSLPSHEQNTTGGGRGRSVSWVREQNNDAASSSIGSEDLFFNTIHGDEVSPHGHLQHHHSMHQSSSSQQHYHHPTILEEDEGDEEAAAAAAAHGARQRALSEPDAGRIRNWLSFHSASSTSTRRRRRRQRAANRTFSESEVVVGGGSARQLSSSAAAALHTQQQQQQAGSQQPIDLLSPNNPQLRVNTSSMVRDRSFTDGGLDNIGAAAAAAAASPPGGGGGGASDHVAIELTNIGGGTTPGDLRLNNSGGSTDSSGQRGPSAPNDTVDRERQARIRWIRINRRFQLVITMVALLFSLLLFGILVCWVVLTIAYAVSFDKSCDVPLKPYFWLVTFQLVLDVFRTDIMRFVFNWDANSNLRIPFRVIVYNVAYLLYAFLVLRMGINSVYVDTDATCRKTAPELFHSAMAFVSLSIAAWTTIVCGYLLPFCIVAALLTYNGYNPSSEAFEDENGATQPVFPAAYSTTGAPTGTVEQLRVVAMEDYPDDYPLECCICMEEFNSFDVVVETRCKHVFHKQCCREWLRQARTCPVCRTDIPTALEEPSGDTTSPTSVTSPAPTNTGSRIPIGPTGRPVVGLFRMFQGESFHSVGGGGGSRSGSPLGAAATPSESQNHSLTSS